MAASTDETTATSPDQNSDFQASRPKTPGSGHARYAANRAAQNNSTEVCLPVLGIVKLPATDELAFLGGVGLLAVAGAIDWPVALVLGAGHTLAANRRTRVVREFGEALEEAIAVA